MRNGLISLLTVVVVGALATAAVLAVATAHALGALSTRHATMTAQGYATERSAQSFVASVDTELFDAREADRTKKQAIGQLEKDMNGLLASACTEDVTATFEMEKTGPHVTFTSTDGRALEVRLAIDDSLTYRITAWKLTAQMQEEGTEDMLWTPTGAND